MDKGIFYPRVSILTYRYNKYLADYQLTLHETINNLYSFMHDQLCPCLWTKQNEY